MNYIANSDPKSDEIPFDLLPDPDSFATLSELDCIAIQKKLSVHICLSNSFSYERSFEKTKPAVHTIAGIDLAYWKEDVEKAVCCIVVLDIKSGEVLEKTWCAGTVSFPYIPGCLAFRELPLVLKAQKKLSCSPDLYMFDGNGILHPRHMGLATHASFYLKKPTLGVAKSYYRISDTDFSPPASEAGSYTDIIVDKMVLGRAVRSHAGVRPFFVSPGNWMDLDTAMAISLSLTTKESHIPAPTRLADLETHAMRAKLK